MADEDIWNNPRISESGIPQILYSHVDDNEIECRKENEEEKNVVRNEDENENEKELELLLSQHFTRSRGSSRNERSSYATEPVRFPNEPQELGDKLDSGLLRQSLPISSSSEHALQDKELQNHQTYPMGYDRQLLFPEKCTDSVNTSAQSSEGFNPNETSFSPEYWSETKENQTAHISDIVSSNLQHHADVPNDQSNNAPGSKTTETLFVGEDVKKLRETISSGDEEAGKLKENALETMDNNAKTVQEQLMQEIASQIPEANSENVTTHEPKREKIESESQLCVSRGLKSHTLADADVTGNDFVSSHSEDTVEEKYKSEYNVDKEKEVMLRILEQSPEKQICSTNRYIKHVIYDNYEINRTDKSPQREEVMTSSVLDEKKEMPQSIGLPYLNDSGINKSESKNSIIDESSHDSRRTEIRNPENVHNTSRLWERQPHVGPPTDERTSMQSTAINTKEVPDTRSNLGERKCSQSDDPVDRHILETECCPGEPDRVIPKDQSTRDRSVIRRWSGSESQLAERQSEVNQRGQMKELTGDEAMGGISDQTRRCLNISPTDELFTCQDALRYEETSVTKHDSTGEAEAVTAAYIIKMTSESIPEKMSAGEKAVIVKLPQETALSDRPTEKKETVFDLHEGINDGSHYPLCQCTRGDVLCDTNFGKESASDIYNVHTHEKVHMEMISTHTTNEILAQTEHNSVNNLPSTEILWTSSAAGKTVSEQGVHSEVPLKHSEHSLEGLDNEEAEEGSIWRPFSHIAPKTKISSLDKNMVESCYESYSVISPKGLVGTHTAEIEKVLAPHMDGSAKIAARAGCNFNPADEITHVILNITKPQEFPPSENREGNISQFSHQTEFSPEKQEWPTIVIREPTEEREETSSDSEDLITEEKLNIVGHGNQPFLDHTGISGQQNEIHNLHAECLVLKHIAYKILYFLFFIVFCVTLYHYDLIVCFALYLFSLYWLYYEGRRNKKSVKKE